MEKKLGPINSIIFISKTVLGKWVYSLNTENETEEKHFGKTEISSLV